MFSMLFLSINSVHSICYRSFRTSFLKFGNTQNGLPHTLTPQLFYGFGVILLLCRHNHINYSFYLIQLHQYIYWPFRSVLI